MTKAKAALRKRIAEDRIGELLDVAAEVFIAEGFSSASTNEIARRANASKTTFYSRFPNKETLFIAVIERRMTRIFQKVARFPELQSVEATLRQFCVNLLRIALSSDQIALVRMISMEASRYPALAARFYENGPKRGELALASYLALQIEKGTLRQGEPHTMARQFINLAAGSPIRWFVLGLDAIPLSKQAQKKHIDETVDLFLRAYRRTDDL